MTFTLDKMTFTLDKMTFFVSMELFWDEFGKRGAEVQLDKLGKKNPPAPEPGDVILVDFDEVENTKLSRPLINRILPYCFF